MQRPIVRINELQLRNFKNVEYGVVTMPAASNGVLFSEKAEPLGIYGQNGSGKTSVIEALHFLQCLLQGKSLPDSTREYISQSSESCTLEIQFSISEALQKETALYHVELRKNEDSFVISQECLSVVPWSEDSRRTSSTLVDYHWNNEKILFLPEYRWKKLVAKDKKKRNQLAVAQTLSIRERCSFIFGEEGFPLFSKCENGAMGEYAAVFSSLRKYALTDLFVIQNTHSGPISMNFVLPMAFYLNDGQYITTGDLPIRIDGPSKVTDHQLALARSVISGLNIVLKTIIPGMEVDIHDFGPQLLENGETGHRIELLSRRGDVSIPLKYESEGIIKIISFLNIFICVYSNPTMCMAIDELDSGIFEYLLGELLSVFSDGGKGQLIFTSHNLRALEMLDKKSILFSTVNPKNRFVRLQNIQANNNLRDVYLRSLTLGGQKEAMYEETDSAAMGRALRRAGKAVWSHG